MNSPTPGPRGPSAPARRLSARWAVWARDRAGRRARRDLARRQARMTMLGRTWRCAGVGTVTRRSFAYGSYLRLAIHPTLVLRVTQRTQVPGPDQRADGRPVVAHRRDDAVKPVWAVKPGWRAAGAAVASAPAAGRRRTEPRRQRPAYRVLREVRPPATRAAVSSRDGGPLRGLIAEVVTLPRRHRRVELPGRHTTPVIREHAAAELGRAPAAALPGPAGDPPDAHRERGPADRERSAVDIDRLTDQIVTRLDDRLTAARERFGRAF